MLGQKQISILTQWSWTYQRLSVVLARGNAALLVNRFPTFASPDIDGVSKEVKSHCSSQVNTVIKTSLFNLNIALNCTPFSERTTVAS